MAQPLLDDALWARLEPLLPKPRRRVRRRGGRPRVSERAALTGILFVLRGGLPWQMLQARNGMRLRQHVLATLGEVGTGRRLASLA